MIASVLPRSRELLKVLRLRPFDVSTEEGRTHERHRRLLLSGLASVAAKGLGILTVLITTPLAIGVLGEERYGLWMTLSSAIVVLSFADLGLGSGLLTRVSQAHGQGDTERIRELVSSAFFLLTGIGALLTMALLLASPLVPWARFFNVHSALAQAEVGPASVVFLACNFALMPLGVSAQVRAGFQASFAQSLWTGLGQLLALAGVLLAIHWRLSLPWMVLAMSGAPVVAALLGSFSFYLWEHPELRPSIARVARHHSRELLGMGVLFLILELSIVLGQASDNFVVAQVLGPARVTDYSVVARLFSFAPMILELLFGPLWPAYTEALARGDIPWVRRTLARTLLAATALVGTSSLVLAVAGRSILHAWVGPAVQPSTALLAGWAVWALLSSLSHAQTMFLNAAGALRFRAACHVSMAIAALALKIELARRFGLAGVVWGVAVAAALFVLLPAAIYVPRLIRRL